LSSILEISTNKSAQFKFPETLNLLYVYLLSDFFFTSFSFLVNRESSYDAPAANLYECISASCGYIRKVQIVIARLQGFRAVEPKVEG
jgi:hypothetical protein